jgi:hypothetical protein
MMLTLEILTRYYDLVLMIATAVMSLACLFARARASERRRRQLRLIRVIASILLIAAAINLRNMLRLGLGPFPALDINYDGVVITDAGVVRSPHNLDKHPRSGHERLAFRPRHPDF